MKRIKADDCAALSYDCSPISLYLRYCTVLWLNCTWDIAMSSNKDSTSAIEQLQNSTAGVLVREQLHSWLRSKQLHYSGWEESNCTPASNCSFLQIIEDNWSRSDAFHWRQITALRIALHFISRCCAVCCMDGDCYIAILLLCYCAIWIKNCIKFYLSVVLCAVWMAAWQQWRQSRALLQFPRESGFGHHTPSGSL